MISFFRPIIFTYKNNKIRGFFFILCIVLALLLIYFTNEKSWWDGFLNPLIGIGTFFFALAVWYGEKYQDWEQKLPKRLTVRFIYENKLAMICKNATLVSEADIRQWGQQIGSQMNNNNRLSFKPFFQIESEPPRILERKFYKPYYLEYYLDALPSHNDTLQAKFAEGFYLHWEQLVGSDKNEKLLAHPESLPPINQNEDL